jgi:hypothetical protein
MDPVRAARGENTNTATEHIDSAWQSLTLIEKGSSEAMVS